MTRAVYKIVYNREYILIFLKHNKPRKQMNTYTGKIMPTLKRACPFVMLIAGLAAGSARADEAQTPAVGSAISGSFSLDCNSHFISYGSDAWATGSKWNEMMVHPSLNLKADLSSNAYCFVGTWLDVNNISQSRIGSTIQEIDAWVGLGYNYGKLGLSVTYQEWTYGGDVERVLDFGASYDTFLHPSITIHNRTDGNGSQKTGTVAVLGVSEGFDCKGLSVNMCLNGAYNTDEYHGGDSGLTFVSFGPKFSYPLSKISAAYGNWNLHGDLTYYYTPSDTVPNNPSESFLTGSIGIGVDF